MSAQRRVASASIQVRPGIYRRGGGL